MLVEEKTSRRGSTPSPRRIAQILRRRLWTIVLVVVVITGSALAFSLYQTPTYEASIKILVGQKSRAKTNLNSSVSGLQTFTLTVAKAVPTTPIAEAVVEQLNLPKGSAGQVVSNMSVAQDPGTMFIDVTYTDSEAKRAQLVANAIGQVVSQKIGEVSLGANRITATLWQPAKFPSTPVSPDPVRNCFIAFILGGLLGVALAFLFEYIDDSWDAPEEVEEISGVPNFCVVPDFDVSASKKVGKKVGILAGRKEGEQ
jgi:capsular polysaccharide biosynthesis protein